MLQSGRFLGRIFASLLKARLPVTKTVSKPLVRNVLIPLGLTAAAPGADARIHKKNLRSGNTTTTLIIFDDETESIMKIVKSLKDSGLLLKIVSKTIQKGEFLNKLLGT